MHYYSFHIADYESHTKHLDPLEDIAYRRMLDWCYLHEKPLPESVDAIARLINMRSHCDSIASVLVEFFHQNRKRQWFNKRADICIAAYRKKSEKARASANARWNKDLPDANALRTECEGNANHKPITNNHKPVKEKTATKRFVAPSLADVIAYKSEKSLTIDPEQFIDFYESKGWIVGKSKMRDWKAAARGWSKREKSNGTHQRSDKPKSHHAQVWDALKAKAAT